MGYRVLDADGELAAGDDVLDDVLKAGALLINGWIIDDAGVIVYESPGRRAALDAEAQPESLTGVVTPPEE